MTSRSLSYPAVSAAEASGNHLTSSISWSWREVSPPTASIRKKDTFFLTRSPSQTNQYEMSPSDSLISDSRPVSSRTSRMAVSPGASFSSTAPFGRPHTNSPRRVRLDARAISNPSSTLRNTTPPAECSNRVFMERRPRGAVCGRSSLPRPPEEDLAHLGLGGPGQIRPADLQHGPRLSSGEIKDFVAIQGFIQDDGEDL